MKTIASRRFRLSFCSLLVATMATGLFLVSFSQQKASTQVSAQVYYGVDINETTGDVSGYAWNDGVGWIDFNPVTFNTSTRQLQGSASITALVSMGEDGSLPMQGDCTPTCGGFGVSLNASNQLVGSAWNDLLGWVVFDHAFGGPIHEDNEVPSVSGYAWNDNIGWIQMSDRDPAGPPPEECSASDFNTCSWAWSDTVGWISHNFVDDPVTPTFGVHINPNNGSVTGHAWNDTLGYIEFNGLYNEVNGEISGTAEILSFGASGTLSLRGDCTPSCGGYGLSIVDDQVTGYAWNDILGWVDFQPAFGGVTYNDRQNPSVTGWAWNDAYGWIAFRFTEYELKWGVNLEQDGNLTGYAWNDNIGWINYDPAGPYPSAPTYSARWDSTTEEVSGWAFAPAIAAGGGDGWIKMRDTGSIPFGVNINGTTGDWTGWGWSDTFGWLAYNHSFGGVFTQFSLSDQGPAAPILQTPLDCTDTYDINPAAALNPALEWNPYSALDGSTQNAYQLQVDTDPLFSAPFIDDTVNSDGEAYSIGLGELAYNTTYYWRVRVQSSSDEWSNWGEEGPSSESNCFRTPLHAPPQCDFNFSPTPPVLDEETTFEDLTQTYGGSTKAFWEWDFGDGESQFGADPIENENPVHTYTAEGEVTISLRVIDSDGYECTTTSDETVAQQLPQFRRIIPR